MGNSVVVFVKDPDSILDYEVGWASWLPDGDAISFAEFFTEPDDVRVENVTFTGSTATVWLSGGYVGQRVRVTCRITTEMGRIEDYSFMVVVRAK